MPRSLVNFSVSLTSIMLVLLLSLMISCNLDSDSTAGQYQRLLDNEDFVAQCRENVFRIDYAEDVAISPGDWKLLSDPEEENADAYWFHPWEDDRVPILGNGHAEHPMVMLAGEEELKIVASRQSADTSPGPACWFSTKTTIIDRLRLGGNSTSHHIDVDLPFYLNTIRFKAGLKGAINDLAEKPIVWFLIDDQRIDAVEIDTGEELKEYVVSFTAPVGSHELTIFVGNNGESGAGIVLNDVSIGLPARGMIVKLPSSLELEAIAETVSISFPYIDEFRLAQYQKIMENAQIHGIKYSPETSPVVPIRLRKDAHLQTVRRSTALFSPASLSTEVSLPEKAYLDLSLAFLNHDSELPITQTSLEIRARSVDGEILKSRILYANGYFTQHWKDYRIDLADIGEQRVKLEFKLSNNFDEEVMVLLGEPIIGSRVNTTEQPNVILISLDTLRGDHVGCYGYERETTPAIDEIARNGVVFKRAYSQSYWTLPSHKSMLTGFYPAPLTFSAPEFAIRPTHTRLPPGTPTIATHLKRAGYSSVAFTEGGLVSSDFGFFKDFDQYSQGTQYSARDIKKIYKDFDTKVIKDTKFYAAKKWLQENADTGPFFMFLHTYRVHTPYTAAKEYQSLFSVAEGDAVPTAITDNYLKRLRWERDTDYITKNLLKAIIAVYDRGIREADDEVAGVVSLLDEMGILDNTILIITSDHGEQFLEHGNFLHDDLYEETLRIPLIFHWPERFSGGTQIDDAVGSVDIVPTILDLVDIEPVMDLHGRSLLNSMEGGLDESLAKRSLFASSITRFSVMNSNYRYHIGLTGNGGSRRQLFNLAHDPTESTDLFERGQAIPVEGHCKLKLLYYIAESLPGWNLLISSDGEYSKVRIQLDGIDTKKQPYGGRFNLTEENSLFIKTLQGPQLEVTSFPALVVFDGPIDSSLKVGLQGLSRATGRWEKIRNIASPNSAKMFASPMKIRSPDNFKLPYRVDEGLPRELIEGGFAVIWYSNLPWNGPAEDQSGFLSEDTLKSLKALGYLN